MVLHLLTSSLTDILVYVPAATNADVDFAAVQDENPKQNEAVPALVPDILPCTRPTHGLSVEPAPSAGNGTCCARPLQLTL